MTRTDVLNTLARVFRYDSYLEIGVAGGENFAAVQCSRKVGVDPVARAATHSMTSDAYFAENAETFDLVFIDGLHHSSQVDTDISNALGCLRADGTIVLHDCNPRSEVLQQIPWLLDQLNWTGDVWKSVARLRMTRKDLCVQVIDVDWGCGIVRRGCQNLFRHHDDLDYAFLDTHRQHLLNLTRPEDWLLDLIKTLMPI